MGAVPSDSVDGMIVMGELALDGTITGVNGVLAAAIGAALHQMGLICPVVNGAEAAWGGDEHHCRPQSDDPDQSSAG